MKFADPNKTADRILASYAKTGTPLPPVAKQWLKRRTMRHPDVARATQLIIDATSLLRQAKGLLCRHEYLVRKIPPARGDGILFSVGPFVYAVEIVTGLLTLSGEPALGRCDYDGMRILIDSSLPPSGRLAIVLHELRHSWSYHVPQPSNAEEDCDLSATITISAMNDLLAQGGEAALRRMQPMGRRPEYVKLELYRRPPKKNAAKESEVRS
ncbi:MAG TPA: hypothetical protein VH370_20540 [Humisphaera sp.]|jgi:hypothetical protein|nr:hypothetical protein [Humisphaera sp.]